MQISLYNVFKSVYTVLMSTKTLLLIADLLDCIITARWEARMRRLSPRRIRACRRLSASTFQVDWR